MSKDAAEKVTGKSSSADMYHGPKSKRNTESRTRPPTLLIWII